MVIDTFQRRFVMNMQLRQCFSRSKPFRLKKSQRFYLASFDFQKKPKVLIKSQNFKIWLEKGQIGNLAMQYLRHLHKSRLVNIGISGLQIQAAFSHASS